MPSTPPESPTRAYLRERYPEHPAVREQSPAKPPLPPTTYCPVCGRREHLYRCDWCGS